MTEPSPVDDVRADIAAIRDATYEQSSAFDFGGSGSDLDDALCALSRIAKSWPPRASLAPYPSAAAYNRDLRRIRDRLEAAIADGLIPASEVLDASSALIDLGRGIALHLRAMRRDGVRWATA